MNSSRSEGRKFGNFLQIFIYTLGWVMARN